MRSVLVGETLLIIVLHVFALVWRHVPRTAVWAVVVALRRPFVGPLVTAALAAIEVAKLCHRRLLDETGEDEGGFALIFQGTNVRVRSRLVATSRDRSHLIYIGDMAVNGVRRN